jgi:hypothetical protein
VEDSVKTNVDFFNATLPALAVTLKWHMTSVVAVLSYFCHFFICIYEENAFCGKRIPWKSIRLPSVNDKAKYRHSLNAMLTTSQKCVVLYRQSS